jgi:hypothetical protein
VTQYLLSVHYVEGAAVPSDDEIQGMYAAVEEFNVELRASGAWVFAGGLMPPEHSTVVSIEDGSVVTTDGPFSKAKEIPGGFWIVEAADLAAALQLAEQGARACAGPVEVRPFQDEPED